MRHLFTALLASALLPMAAHGENPNARDGEHGMALFGNEQTVYASHLPMFHRPHDVQLIVRVRITDPDVAKDVGRRLARAKSLWTLVPQPFDLNMLAPDAPDPVRRIKADIVEGHFERGGRTRWRDVDVALDPVSFDVLDPTPRQAASARFHTLGAGRDRFLVHTLDSRPDFDMIIAIRDCPAFHPDRVLTVPRVEDEVRTVAAVVERLPHSCTQAVPLYFETGDLR